MDVIQLHGVKNIRDLGGMRTSDGRALKLHKLIRSSKLSGLTDNDIRILTKEYNVKQVIDLRADFEIANTPDPQLPDTKYHVLSLIDKETMGLTHGTEDYDTLKDFSQLPTMETLYASFVIDCIPKQWEKIFDILLANTDGSVLWHCSEGKDRCGIVSVLVEYALGCSMEDIEKDYLLTNDTAVQRSKMVYEIFLSNGLEQQKAEKFSKYFLANINFLHSAISAINDKYGNMDNFLEKACNLTTERRTLLKQMYCI